MPNGMDDEKIIKLRDRVSFISGSSKNVGKTTFLNYLLPRFRRVGEFVFLTIGIDGERKDQIFGTDKPVIKTEIGDYLLTSESLMKNSSGSFEICQVFPWKSVMGKLLLIKTKRGGLIELAGPENNLQLEKIITYIRESVGIETIIIDGAVNRLTQISSSRESGFFYVIKINRENFYSSLDRMRVMSILDKQDKFDSHMKEAGIYRHKGAFTKKCLKSLDDSYHSVVLEDFTKVFLSYIELKQLLKRNKVYFQNILSLEAFICNLYDINREDFLIAMNEAGIESTCIFNPYEIE